MNSSKALVVLSGGQDSTICLFWAKQKYDQARAVFFNYGQRHLKAEFEAAAKIAKMAEVPLDILPLSLLPAIGNSALLRQGKIDEKHKSNSSLPASFVPGRNLLFLTAAASLAYKEGINHIITGVCQTDYSGYPDCRRETIDALEKAISLGMDSDFWIRTPLMRLTKAKEVEMAEAVGAMEALAFSHTCYEGQFPPCGKCPACILRANGFEEAGIEDPLIIRARNEQNE